MNRNLRGYSLRVREPYRRMTKAERDEILNILFEWRFAERIVDEHLTIPEIQEELRRHHFIDVTIAQLKNLRNRWYCDYNEDHSIKRIYRL